MTNGQDQEVSHVGHPAYEPHPHALLIPGLTDDEYAALKEDITRNGIIYPAVVDEECKILDGVHRWKIANELGIDLPAVVRAGLSDEGKLHAAVGLNMRRRHLDADKRRELVRKLHDDEHWSVRKIAEATGWSKSTVDRDLKYGQEAAALTARIKSQIAELERLQREATRLRAEWLWHKAHAAGNEGRRQAAERISENLRHQVAFTDEGIVDYLEMFEAPELIELMADSLTKVMHNMERECSDDEEFTKVMRPFFAVRVAGIRDWPDSGCYADLAETIGLSPLGGLN